MVISSGFSFDLRPLYYPLHYPIELLRYAIEKFVTNEYIVVSLN